MRCFFEAARVESDGGRGEASACCVFVVMTMLQPASDLDLMISLSQVVGGTAAVLRRRVP